MFYLLKLMLCKNPEREEDYTYNIYNALKSIREDNVAMMILNKLPKALFYIVCFFNAVYYFAYKKASAQNLTFAELFTQHFFMNVILSVLIMFSCVLYVALIVIDVSHYKDAEPKKLHRIILTYTTIPFIPLIFPLTEILCFYISPYCNYATHIIFVKIITPILKVITPYIYKHPCIAVLVLVLAILILLVWIWHYSISNLVKTMQKTKHPPYKSDICICRCLLIFILTVIAASIFFYTIGADDAKRDIKLSARNTPIVFENFNET